MPIFVSEFPVTPIENGCRVHLGKKKIIMSVKNIFRKYTSVNNVCALCLFGNYWPLKPLTFLSYAN